MRHLLLFALGLLLLPSASLAQALLSFAKDANLDIPDGSIVGVASTQHIVTGLDAVGEIRLTVNIEGRGLGGLNGDLFAYLAHDGQIAVLLNRPGRTVLNRLGYSGNGLSVRFDDGAAQNIHLYEDHLPPGPSRLDPLLGTWQPDGRVTDPASVLDTDWSSAMLSTFRGGTPDGDWTLFVTDLESGGTSRLVSWELEIALIPEPVFVQSVAGLGLLVLCAFRRRASPDPMGRRPHPANRRSARRGMAGCRRGCEPLYYCPRRGPAVLPLTRTVTAAVGDDTL